MGAAAAGDSSLGLRCVMPTFLCPVCDSAIDPNNKAALPFCSERCRQIDLGRWLDERYSMPAPKRDDPDSDEPQDGNADD
jgi:endogenous inhibitor of DNA gyrase (YacG/DUF329 family)